MDKHGRYGFEMHVSQKCKTCGTKLPADALKCAFCTSKDLAAIPEETIKVSEYLKPF